MKSVLDAFLLKRIEENRKTLKKTLDDTLQIEQVCLNEIVKGISFCKKNISRSEKLKDKADLSSIMSLNAKKEAFSDNLIIWNTLGHIQMASIEMKQYTKRLSADNDEWQQQDAIKGAYIAIYETSEKLINNIGKVIKFIKQYFPNYDFSTLKVAKTNLSEFRNDNAEELKYVRNNIGAHRDNEICKQLKTIENLHLSVAIKLVLEYENIINDLGVAVSPIKQLGINRLEMVCRNK